MRSMRPAVLDSWPVLSLRVVKLDVADKHPGSGEKQALCNNGHSRAAEKAGDVREADNMNIRTILRRCLLASWTIPFMWVIGFPLFWLIGGKDAKEVVKYFCKAMWNGIEGIE